MGMVKWIVRKQGTTRSVTILLLLLLYLSRLFPLSFFSLFLHSSRDTITGGRFVLSLSQLSELIRDGWTEKIS